MAFYLKYFFAILLLVFGEKTGALAWCGTSGPKSNPNDTKIVTVVEPPFVFKNSTCINIFGGTGQENQCYSGFSIDVINMISRELQFNYTIYDVSDYGELSNSTGKWNGAIGALMENGADIAIGGLEVTPERQNATDMTSPISVINDKSYAMAVKKGNSELLGSLNHLIAKLANQRHFDQLVETWWTKPN